METRDLYLLQMRTEVTTGVQLEKMRPEEKFQNQTLRPVVNLQHDLLVESFRNYIGKHKNAFYHLDIEKRLVYIENSIQKDIKFRNSLKGMIIGQFTLDEYRFYITNSSALNKRMMHLVKECLQDSVQLFEPLAAF